MKLFNRKKNFKTKILSKSWKIKNWSRAARDQTQDLEQTTDKKILNTGPWRWNEIDCTETDNEPATVKLRRVNEPAIQSQVHRSFPLTNLNFSRLRIVMWMMLPRLLNQF